MRPGYRPDSISGSARRKSRLFSETADLSHVFVRFGIPIRKAFLRKFRADLLLLVHDPRPGEIVILLVDLYPDEFPSGAGAGNPGRSGSHARIENGIPFVRVSADEPLAEIDGFLRWMALSVALVLLRNFHDRSGIFFIGKTGPDLAVRPVLPVNICVLSGYIFVR